MSKSVFVLAFLVLISVTVCSASYYRKCNGVLKKCKTKANSSIILYGTGDCRARATSYCSARATAYSCHDFSSQSVYGACRRVYINDDVECLARAAARAYASAYSSAVCNGKSAYACSSAKSHAEAIACAIAKSVISLSADLGHHRAKCEVDIAAMVKAFAKAAAEATASTCVYGNGIPKFDSDYAFGRAVQTAIAKAYGSCYVYCPGYGSYTYVSAYGTASGSTTESEYSYGGGVTETGDD